MRALSRLPAVSSAGVFFARPLVGSRWTARQGPLAQKTPTLLSLPRATRTSLARPLRSVAPSNPYFPCEDDALGICECAGVRVARRRGSLAKRGCPGAPPAANESELQGGEGALSERPAEP